MLELRQKEIRNSDHKPSTTFYLPHLHNTYQHAVRRCRKSPTIRSLLLCVVYACVLVCLRACVCVHTLCGIRDVKHPAIGARRVILTTRYREFFLAFHVYKSSNHVVSLPSLLLVYLSIGLCGVRERSIEG